MASNAISQYRDQEDSEIHLATGRRVVNCVDFYQREGSISLLVAGCDDRVVIWTCQIKEYPGDTPRLSDVVDFTNILEVKTATEVEHISWIPKTTYLKFFIGEAFEEEGELFLFFAGSDHHVYRIDSDLKTTEVVPIGKHKERVRDVAVRPLSGEEGEAILAASVSCDCRCVVWNVQFAEIVLVLKLKSWGVSVCWHPLEPMQIMVAEMTGTIRFYRIDTGQALKSLLAPSQSIRSASWCPLNPQLVGAGCGEECCLWDVSVGFPMDSRPVHLSGTLQFKWSPSSDSLFSTLGLDSEVKIHHKGHKVAMVKKLPVAKAMTWLLEAGVQLLVVCSSGHLCVWHVKD